MRNPALEKGERRNLMTIVLNVIPVQRAFRHVRSGNCDFHQQIQNGFVIKGWAINYVVWQTFVIRCHIIASHQCRRVQLTDDKQHEIKQIFVVCGFSPLSIRIHSQFTQKSTEILSVYSHDIINRHGCRLTNPANSGW